MATKNIFASMLNQKPIAAPQLKAPGVKRIRPPGVKEFAYLGAGGPGRSMLTHEYNDIAPNLWGKIMKSKGGI